MCTCTHTHMPYVWPHGESFCFKLPDSRTGLHVRACVRACVQSCVRACCMLVCVRACVCIGHTVISVHVLSYTSSGLTEDWLAFHVSFVNNERFHFRVAKPSEWKSWVERVEMVGALWLEHCMDVDDYLSPSRAQSCITKLIICRFLFSSICTSTIRIRYENHGSNLHT